MKQTCFVCQNVDCLSRGSEALMKELTDMVAAKAIDAEVKPYICFGGCDFEVFNPDGSCNQQAIEAWIRDPSAVKLGAKMPDYGLPDDQITALTDYLCSLN